MKPLKELVRPNIWNLTPYSSARDEFKGLTAHVFCDANENPFNDPLNRYPDPAQGKLKEVIAKVKGIPSIRNIFLGNGSDEAIDLLFRVFCRPGTDNVVAIDPTYGMYAVCADVNDVEYRKVPLHGDYGFAATDLLAACDERTKLIFVCSPNNPTGNDLDYDQIISLISLFQGIVVVDEAYNDFSSRASLTRQLGLFPNLVVLQTMSKAWGLASIRLGMAFADEEIVSILNKVKYPYNVNGLTQQKAMEALAEGGKVRQWVDVLLFERARMERELALIPCVRQTHKSDANFLLVKVTDPVDIYRYLVSKGIVVRNRHTVSLCENCLRITIGTPQENAAILNALKQYNNRKR